MNDRLLHVSSSELPCERLGAGWVLDDWRDELEDDIMISHVPTFFDGKGWGLQAHPGIKVHLSPHLKARSDNCTTQMCLELMDLIGVRG